VLASRRRMPIEIVVAGGFPKDQAGRRQPCRELAEVPLFDPLNLDVAKMRFTMGVDEKIVNVHAISPLLRPQRIRAGGAMQRARAGRTRCSGRRRTFACRKINFDPRMVRIEKEELPYARRCAALRYPPQIERNPALLELGDVAGQVRPPEGHVVEHAAFARRLRLLDDVEDRLAVVIEPYAGEREIGPRTGLEPEELAVEFLGSDSVLGHDRKVVHPLDRHGEFSGFGATMVAGAASSHARSATASSLRRSRLRRRGRATILRWLSDASGVPRPAIGRR